MERGVLLLWFWKVGRKNFEEERRFWTGLKAENFSLTCLAIWAFTSDCSSFRWKVDSHDLIFDKGWRKKPHFHHVKEQRVEFFCLFLYLRYVSPSVFYFILGIGWFLGMNWKKKKKKKKLRESRGEDKKDANEIDGVICSLIIPWMKWVSTFRL